MPARRARLADVAARAGVSAATASRSLRGIPKVSDDTRQRVLDAATDYSEACLSFCDLVPRCHARALAEDDPIVLGGEVARLLGDTSISRALELMAGAKPDDDREADLQRQLAG